VNQSVKSSRFSKALQNIIHLWHW